MTTSKTVNYWAVSVFSSRTMWFGFLTALLGVLSLPEVLTLVPSEYMPAVLAVTGVITMILRFVTVRPVAMIAPGEVQATRVEKISTSKMRDLETHS